MKILAIRGKNLASLEGEFTIDFTVEPLKSAGIFAITGTTGSGKSTLLDALCLALFDNTPRTNHASENIHIADVREKTILQKDSRNILRKGSSDGYAEVDFVSLGGEKFCSQWSVRRARGNADGTLQNSEIRLKNLTTNIEVQGKKTELLTQIVKLIGLTFEQFTRAVLLAQGDFATFLKATQREKAELLEKLTGTDIYSRISIGIYEKSKSAEQELGAIQERINDVPLLSNEQLESLTQEKISIAKEIKSIKVEIEKLTVNIKWINDECILKDGFRQAEELQEFAKKRLEEAKPRNEYLLRVDRVQEIRERYYELINLQKQLEENKNSLLEKEKQRKENHLLLEELLAKVTISETEIQKWEEKKEKIEPEIKQARALDIQVTGAKKNAEEARIELKEIQNLKENHEKSIEKSERNINETQKKLSLIHQWFEENIHYQEIIPRIDLISTIISDCISAKKQKELNANTLQSSKAVLESEIITLGESQKKMQELNQLLPAEIAVLREKLVEGVPCPVCGSTHHPDSQKRSDSLEEKKLENEKRVVGEEITTLLQQIEKRKSEHIRLKSLIESYLQQSEEAMAKLKKYLINLPKWEDTFESGTLKKSLETVADTWRKNELDQSKANEQIAHWKATLQFEKDRLSETSNQLSVKELKCKSISEEFSQLQAKRAALLKGKEADDVEKLLAENRKKLVDTLSRQTEEKNSRIASDKKQEGIISQLSKEIARLSGECDKLRESIHKWLLAQNGEFSEEELKELLSKDSTWLVQERAQLEKLKQNETAAAATLQERRQNLDKHELSENRPSQEEDKDEMKERLIFLEESMREKTDRHAKIEVLFENHEKGKERIKKFEKEIEEKKSLAENWKRLNEVFGSADGAKFKVLAQGYTLDALLVYANKQLKELSKRYEIERIPNTLALQVIDLDMLGEIRTVHSLSGGESFLISLALALGLSSLSSNRMKIESLFIDEGFGSLDVETLRVAMDALERLQTQGRKIGVISHVAEMTERIGVQIQVKKIVNGKSRVEICH